ncbi:hypothetical protein GCM10011321_00670 [Youhaiella tibetensis]|uniref:Uncharacterized protein n=1 Tax=Paradevosia tibetensis TaxID=1447062 RepID=A0A5B9DTL7_9HYPH|nr:hypothetical protein [Youhaiella tibetensis]QEE21704.1 hypothetical protein FNA67_16580 [Youhaiella tibetensis]GGF12464.1 hypothetical protein GCM10011321_00670 [Youhaiella tibetensis]
MSQRQPPRRPAYLRALRALARFVVAVVVIVYMALDELLFPLFRPFIGWLSGLRIFELVGAIIARLPPYVVLVLLAVPFVIIEPAKVFALYWGATGHVVEGTVLLVAAEILSIFTCDRIYHTGHGQLMKIGWFRRLMEWLVGLRDKALGWVRSTGLWQAAAKHVRAARAWLRGVIASLR